MVPEILAATAVTDEEDWENASWFDADDESIELAETLRDVLTEDYVDADPEGVEDALADMLDSMSAAEAFNFTKALKQIQRTAGTVVSDPAFGRLAGTALPVASGALGTLIGGPAGTAVGSRLGSAAASALAGATRRPSAVPGLAGTTQAGTAPDPTLAGGSAAAAQGLVLTQQPDILKSLLALSLGKHGTKSINGMPVAQVMNLLSAVFGQAAADADELMYLDDRENPTDSEEFTYHFAADEVGTGRELYTTLLDADNVELAEAWE